MVTRAEQVAVVDGVRLDGVSNILVAEQVAKLPFARTRGRLYVLVEPLGDRSGWEGLCREIAQAVHDEYYESSGSVTAGLRRALERANGLLCDMNLAESRRAPRWAGLSAVVLKGNDVFIAQTGPALVYVIRSDVATRFPDDSPWLDMSPRQAMEEGYAAPIGLRRELSVDLFHTQLAVGDSIVLAESQVAEFLDGEEIAQTFRESDPDSVQRLQALFADRDLSLLVVRAGAADGAVVPQAASRLGPLSGDTMAAPAWPLAASERSDSGAGPQALLRDMGERVARTSATLSDRVRLVWRRMLPGSESRRIERAVRRQTGVFSASQVGGHPPADERLVLIGMVAGVVVLALAGYLLLRWQSGRVQEARVRKGVESAQAKLDESRQEADPARKRQLVIEGVTILSRVSDSPAAGREAEDLGKMLDSELDGIDRVVRVYWLPSLRQYADPGTAMSDLVVHGIDVYTLDTGLGRVYKRLFNPIMDGLQELDEQVPEVLLRTGDLRDNLTVGRLRGMTWMPPGPGREWGSLLVLDESGALLEYEPSAGIRVLPAAARAQLQDPRAIAGYEGRLLVLDAKLNQILVFEPGSGGYDTAPVPYTGTDLMLSGVVDMAVDGDVYLLYADGLVVKLRGGERTAFELTGLSTRVKNPTSVFVTPDTEDRPGSVYITDSGNSRVVQFTKDGQFVRQFLPERGSESLFYGLTSVYVDEAAQKMVLMCGNDLRLANVPLD